MREDERFEWDGNKSARNARKHGISFEEACRVWDDPFMYRVMVAKEPEARWLCVGRVGRSEYVSVVITYRGECIRIISARTATKREVQAYYG